MVLCVVLYGIIWYYMVLYGIMWYYMISNERVPKYTLFVS
jgi:hypothetical protein